MIHVRCPKHPHRSLLKLDRECYWPVSLDMSVRLFTPILDHKVLKSKHLLITLVVIYCALPMLYLVPDILYLLFHFILQLYHFPPKKATIILIFTKERL